MVLLLFATYSTIVLSSGCLSSFQYSEHVLALSPCISLSLCALYWVNIFSPGTSSTWPFFYPEVQPYTSLCFTHVFS